VKAMKVDFCIASAGIGSRFEPFSLFANKGLAPIPFKPLICELIDQIPTSSDIYIATGHHGKDLMHVVNLFYPKRNIYEQPNLDYECTGMGDSILSTLEKLENPLCILPNDGVYSQFPSLMFGDSIDIALGCVPVSQVDNPADYLCLSADTKGRLRSYCRNNITYSNNLSHGLVFTGFMYIRNPREYARLLKACDSPREVYSPFRSIVTGEVSCKCILVDWIDCGTYPKYKAYVSSRSQYDFSKEDETLLLEKDKPVVKIFKDKMVALKRVSKAHAYPKAFPECKALPSGYGYSYKYIKAKTLYEDCSTANLVRLLSFLDEYLWKPTKSISLEGDSRLFYKGKTESRIALLNSKYDLSKIRSINGRLLGLNGIVPAFDFEAFISSAISSPIHGDLQYDNVLIGDSGIVLLDWRHEFGSNNLHGDLYYDFAKLIGGILLNYHRIKRGEFYCELTGGGESISYAYEQDEYAEEHLSVLTDFIDTKGFSVKHCWKLLSLIYLNMSPLHRYPFDLMLLAMSVDINEKHL